MAVYFSLTSNPYNPIPYGQSTTVSWQCYDADYGSLTRTIPDNVSIGGTGGAYVTPPLTTTQRYNIWCVDEGFTGNQYANGYLDVTVDYTCPAGTSGSQPNCTCNNGATNPPTCTAAPAAPSYISAVCGSGGTSATVSWGAVSGATRYGPRIATLYSGNCNPGWSSTVPGGSGTCYIDTMTSTSFAQSFGITPGVTYNIWVHAGNAYNWSGPTSNTFNCTASTPVLSISASGSPSEPSTTGTYTISRTGSTASAQAFGINSMTGTATRCTTSITPSSCSTSNDYVLTGCGFASGSSINGSIPAGASSCAITLTPIDNATSESSESATMTLNTSGGGYTLGTSAATLNIADNDGGADTVSILATDSTAGEPSSAGEFAITRSGSTASALAITFSVVSGSTATRCTASSYGSCATTTDYYLSGCSISGSGTTLTIPAGSSACMVSVSAVDNSTAESAETVRMTITAPAGYTLGSSYDQVTISDNDASSFGFTIDAPASITLTRGATNESANVSATLTSGTGELISPLYIVGLPSGVSYSFSPDYCTPTDLTCFDILFTTQASAPLGTDSENTLYASNSGGTASDSDNFSVTVQDAAQQSFGFSIAPHQSLTIAAGNSAEVDFSATLTSGTTQTVNSFTAFSDEPGISLSFDGAPCQPTQTYCQTATVSVGAGVADGTYPVSVYAYAQDGSTSASTLLYVEVGTGAGGPAELTVEVVKNGDVGEPGVAGQVDTNSFTLTRFGGSGDVSAALPVIYSVSTGSGQATPDTDYTLDGTCESIGTSGATIPAYQASCTIVVTALPDADQEATEFVTITLESPPAP